MTKRRTYFMFVELHSGEGASLTIIRDKDRVAAQLRSFGDYLKQVSFQVNRLNFESEDIWTLLALVELGFRDRHGVRYEYSGPADKTQTVDEYVSWLEARANDPRYFVFQKHGEIGWSYGVREHDLPAILKEMRASGQH